MPYKPFHGLHMTLFFHPIISQITLSLYTSTVCLLVSFSWEAKLFHIEEP